MGATREHAPQSTQEQSRPEKRETQSVGGGGAQPAWQSYVRSLSGAPPVQAKGDTGDPEAVHAAAETGVQGSGGKLPHAEAIQRSFGHHDVSEVEAHVGGAAAEANEQIGSEAYAMGGQVAFKQSPDLHTAAHEAAHVVQQRGGVQLKDGVGRAGDEYERHADAVADRVVQGRSAEDLLDSVAGSTRAHGTASAPVQKKDEAKKKVVSSTAMKRLVKAEEAIKHAKSVFMFGAGNQAEALRATNFNSYYRLKVMRDPSCWELADSVKPIAAANPDALTAAKADLAHGGNCGEHAQVAFDYLRVQAAGEKINRADVSGLDHAFVLIGDVGKEGDADIVVSDPWPTAATATIWEDHFAFTPDRKQINIRNSMTADGKNVKAVIAAGLRLSARGQKMLEAKLDDKQTEEQVEKGLGGWVWDHQDAAARGKKYEYTTESESDSE